MIPIQTAEQVGVDRFVAEVAAPWCGSQSCFAEFQTMSAKWERGVWSLGVFLFKRLAGESSWHKARSPPPVALVSQIVQLGLDLNS